MPVWCPKCHAMLAEGAPKCPRCGANLPRPDPNALTPQEFKAILWEAYKFALLPVALAVLLGFACLIILSLR